MGQKFEMRTAGGLAEDGGAGGAEDNRGCVAKHGGAAETKKHTHGESWARKRQETSGVVTRNASQKGHKKRVPAPGPVANDGFFPNHARKHLPRGENKAWDKAEGERHERASGGPRPVLVMWGKPPLPSRQIDEDGASAQLVSPA